MKRKQTKKSLTCVRESEFKTGYSIHTFTSAIYCMKPIYIRWRNSESMCTFLYTFLMWFNKFRYI